MRGKKKCELLKSIRCKIARQNGLDYTISECKHQGDCKGTCPKCEEELRQLANDLERIKQSGKRVAVAGIAAAVVATSATACTPRDHDDSYWEIMGNDDLMTGYYIENEPDPEIEGKQLPADYMDGDYDIHYEEELTGDVAAPTEEE